MAGRGRHRTVAAGAIAMLLLLIVAGPARAEVLGTLTITPATGSDDSGIGFDTSAACPDAATNVVVTVAGAGFPAGGTNVVGNIAISALPGNAAGGYGVPITRTLRDYAAEQVPPATLSGRYDFTLICRTALNPTSLGDFTGAIWFTSPTAYQSTDPGGGGPTPTPTGTPTGTPTPTLTPTPTDTPTPTGTPTPTDSPTPTETPTPTDTPVPTDTPTATDPGGGQGLGVTVPSGSPSPTPIGRLPNTGAYVEETVGLGLALLLAGFVLTDLGRRRRPAVPR